MRFPRVPGPPEWYWRLPLRWRQRYCRWFVWKWEAARRIFTNILSRTFVFGTVPRIAGYVWRCREMDRREGLPLRDSLAYLVPYVRYCIVESYYREADDD